MQAGVVVIKRRVGQSKTPDATIPHRGYPICLVFRAVSSGRPPWLMLESKVPKLPNQALVSFTHDYRDQRGLSSRSKQRGN